MVGIFQVNVNTSMTSVLVKLILQPGSLTDGDLADFQFRPSDVIICHKAEVKGLSVVSKAWPTGPRLSSNQLHTSC